MHNPLRYLYKPIEVIRFAVMEYVRSANGRLYEPFDVKAVYMVDASGFYARACRRRLGSEGEVEKRGQADPTGPDRRLGALA
jgi:hypothetical protein